MATSAVAASSVSASAASLVGLGGSLSRKSVTVINGTASFFGRSLPRVTGSRGEIFPRRKSEIQYASFFQSVGMKKPSWFPSFGGSPKAQAEADVTSVTLGPDDDVPGPGLEFATFAAGCFWGVELAYQRVPGVVKTEVGYTQGRVPDPSYDAVCSGATGHTEAVRVQYDPREVSYGELLDLLWTRIDPTTLNRQGNDWGTQYRSGVYFYSPEQERIAQESFAKLQEKLGQRKIVTELKPAEKFYPAESYHQQYLSKGGRFGTGQSAVKGCKDPIRCYG